MNLYEKKTVNLGPNKTMHPHIEALVFFINFCPIKEGNGEKISGANASVILKFPDGLGTSPQASGGFPPLSDSEIRFSIGIRCNFFA